MNRGNLGQSLVAVIVCMLAIFNLSPSASTAATATEATAVAAITTVYNQYASWFGSPSGGLQTGSSGSSTYYFQWYTNGAALVAWPDGYMYLYDGQWYQIGVNWQTLGEAATEIMTVYNQYASSLGTPSGGIITGTSGGVSCYIQWYTNGTALVAWTDGYMYMYNGQWNSLGVSWTNPTPTPTPTPSPTPTPTPSTTPSPTPTPTTGGNVLSLTVNGSLCSAANSSGYANKPCVSVTICTPGTATCQTINDILLDTMSTGLRVFKSVLSVSLTPVTAGSGTLVECMEYGDGSADWGYVATASVILGSEPAVTVPVHVIDSTFDSTFSGIPGGSSGCVLRQNPYVDTSPAEAGFNGILGVNVLPHDCGSDCVNNANNQTYYSCGGGRCSGTTVALSNQVQNPVALLPQDNNGVIVQLPGVSLGGVASVSGSLVLGIGTQSNNSPLSTVTVYPTDQYADLTTTFNGVPYNGNGFIDSGSNALFFQSPSASTLPDCSASSSADGFYCPTATQSFTASNQGINGSPSGTVSFQIGNASSLFNSNNNVFVELGGDGAGEFDWGLPFFFGRSVYYGIDGTKSTLGTGPYVAY
ncbi:DUF3443 domain-containing protein [Candidatus Magnetominusculus dajiuhuensis]|uniref:DUF3443 domain-containing protein n=1 Tax=Candidatus Magnetominusculus dajiuhuensis TaxID=3137712 RepID=UPI003B43374E